MSAHSPLLHRRLCGYQVGRHLPSLRAFAASVVQCTEDSPPITLRPVTTTTVDAQAGGSEALLTLGDLEKIVDVGRAPNGHLVVVEYLRATKMLPAHNSRSLLPGCPVPELPVSSLPVQQFPVSQFPMSPTLSPDDRRPATFPERAPQERPAPRHSLRWLGFRFSPSLAAGPLRTIVSRIVSVLEPTLAGKLAGRLAGKLTAKPVVKLTAKLTTKPVVKPGGLLVSIAPLRFLARKRGARLGAVFLVVGTVLLIILLGGMPSHNSVEPIVGSSTSSVRQVDKPQGKKEDPVDYAISQVHAGSVPGLVQVDGSPRNLEGRVVSRNGEIVLVEVTSVIAGQKTIATLLLQQSESGWRTRDVFDAVS